MADSRKVWRSPSLLLWLGLLIALTVTGMRIMRTENLRTPSRIYHHSTGAGKNRFRGSVERRERAWPSLNGQRREVFFYLPPSFYRHGPHLRRYPTLYLLHGNPALASEWLVKGRIAATLDRMIRDGSLHECLVVMPDGNGGYWRDSEFVNALDGSANVEDFIAKDLVNYVDLHFRTRRSRGARALGGISMGGYGATIIGVHHPEQFSIIVSVGGYYEPRKTRRFRQLLGKDRLYREWYSPLAIVGKAAPTLAHQSLYVAAGDRDPPGLEQARKWHASLLRQHVHHVFHVFHGEHEWPLFRKTEPYWLEFVDTHWNLSGTDTGSGSS